MSIQIVTGPSFNNVAMQLRHCCNHPFLLKGVEFRELESSGHGVAEAQADAVLALAGGYDAILVPASSGGKNFAPRVAARTPKPPL